MLIQRKMVGTKGMFYVQDEEEVLAQMVYSMPTADKMIIEHTDVSETLRGKNVGLQMVTAAVDYARANHLTIIAVCPFAISVFNKKPEFADVLER